MELVYLWVEEYKNIKKQGFNFSPRFDCKFHDEYDENNKLQDDCKLEINLKEYTNIFPDNINITAIIGENGVGKTTILGLINTIISQLNIEIPTKYIVIVNINNHQHFRTNIDNISMNEKFLTYLFMMAEISKILLNF